MTDFLPLHPTITVHLTIVFGISASLSAAGLALLFGRSRGSRKLRRSPSRWRIEYQSRTGVQFHISKTPPDAAGPSAQPHR